MRIHELKTWPMFFERVARGKKSFEVRENDRDFQVGDRLDLLEYDPVKKEFTDRELVCKVTYILHGGQFGIEPGYCVMSIEIEP